MGCKEWEMQLIKAQMNGGSDGEGDAIGQTRKLHT
jgi:hypothetical protein